MADSLNVLALPQVYTALNALGSVGWQINKEVLAAVKAVWEGGGGLADIPSTIDVPLPPPLSHRYRLSYDGVQLLAAFGPPSYHEDRAWRNLVMMRGSSVLAAASVRLSSARKAQPQNRHYAPRLTLCPSLSAVPKSEEEELRASFPPL